MPHPIAPGFVTETEIRQLATLLNANRYPDHHVLMITAGDLRRFCTTAMIGARLIEASADLAFDYGFTPTRDDTADVG
ncbi:MAG: hypothetical protein PHT60_13980 [Acidiphilium sp.]|nr:hypothetical protein [Acidiphilium sp.]MDD4936874.1 hypothetical protein [Acidiphilium sp.]